MQYLIIQNKLLKIRIINLINKNLSQLFIIAYKEKKLNNFFNKLI